LPIVQSNEVMDELFSVTKDITINLDAQTIQANNKTYAFEVDEERKRRLMNGLDDIALTLQYSDDIKTFESQYFKTYSWL